MYDLIVVGSLLDDCSIESPGRFATDTRVICSDVPLIRKLIWSRMIQNTARKILTTVERTSGVAGAENLNSFVKFWFNFLHRTRSSFGCVYFCCFDDRKIWIIFFVNRGINGNACAQALEYLIKFSAHKRRVPVLGVQIYLERWKIIPTKLIILVLSSRSRSAEYENSN